MKFLDAIKATMIAKLAPKLAELPGLPRGLASTPAHKATQMRQARRALVKLLGRRQALRKLRRGYSLKAARA